MADKICVGAIAGALGVRGEVRVRAFTRQPEDVAAYGPVETEDGRTLAIRVVRALKDGMVAARIGGIADRDRAEALRGTKLYVPRALLPEPEEEEFYYADLIGLAVVDRDGAVLGRVKAVHDFGAGDLLDVAPEGGGGSVLLPFTREAVPEVDLAAGRIVADPPPGLFAAATPSEGASG